MSPEDKAKQLFRMFSLYASYNGAINCAIACVDQLIRCEANPPDSNVLGYWELVIKELRILENEKPI